MTQDARTQTFTKLLGATRSGVLEGTEARLNDDKEEDGVGDEEEDASDNDGDNDNGDDDDGEVDSRGLTAAVTVAVPWLLRASQPGGGGDVSK
jgi:hypothetical protein